ncbi:hypothetical protein DPMN_058087 [Dreissena polymorpha]|uniref:Uncharacterized protein n=1 Tax=Dreissena polymorpha TaxID=45954 RepID=A0A9D4C1H1_DREPO|nr:hypothetical protein DPMN_058087 [Dreissena polymorpha]
MIGCSILVLGAILGLGAANSYWVQYSDRVQTHTGCKLGLGAYSDCMLTRTWYSILGLSSGFSDWMKYSDWEPYSD